LLPTLTPDPHGNPAPPHPKGHIRLTDFGSARCLGGGAPGEEEEGGVEPESGRVEGTVEYVAPEVAAGATLTTYQSDAWALGCVVFQLLAGHCIALHDETEVQI